MTPSVNDTGGGAQSWALKNRRRLSRGRRGVRGIETSKGKGPEVGNAHNVSVDWTHGERTWVLGEWGGEVMEATTAAWRRLTYLHRPWGGAAMADRIGPVF